MENEKKYTDYFGFDLGDGESAVAWMRAGKKTEPQMIELKGRKSIITALASHPEKGLTFGEEACHLGGADWLEVRFKSRYLKEKAAAGSLIGMFAREVLASLTADGRLESPETACFFIGCPSGWSREVREEYKKLFERAGMVNCEIVSESRAAFMFARESGELRVSDDLLTLPTLIIDAGSSTTDFTYVADLSERSLTAKDFGDVNLGGGLIDRLLLERNVKRSPVREQVESVFERYPQYLSRCEFEARRVKEIYFTQALSGGLRAESAVKIYVGRTPLTLEISCDEDDMRAMLAEPLAALGGRSYERTYREALESAKAQLGEAKPEVILLTGGASRMPFIGSMAKDVFENAQILRGLEPEFAIARGLCYALRIDQKTQGFMEAVEDLIRSEDMEDLVLSRLPELFETISGPLTDKLIDEIAPEVFALWRAGGLKTFNDIGTELSERLQRMMADGELGDVLRPCVREWVLRLRPDIEQMTDPICDKFDLPRTSLRLPESLNIGVAQVEVGGEKLLKIEQFKVLIDVIVAAILASILGGSGIALITTGVPGLVGGFVLGLLAAVVGTEAAERMLRKAELPIPMRRMITTHFFKKNLDKRRSDIRAGLCGQLTKELDPPSENVRSMVLSIASSIEEQLGHMMERAALLIH